jgi:sugar (pentulose or hexulose) kinase
MRNRIQRNQTIPKGGAVDRSPLLGGLDVGTTSVKAVLMTYDGVEVAHGRAPTVWTRNRDGVEADPYAIVDAAMQALADALSAVPGRTVSALGVASMAESGVLVAADDAPLAPVIAWHDSRDAGQLADLDQQLGGARFSLRTGLPLWTQWSLTKHRWLQDNDPQTGAAVRRYSIAEWVVRQLGGQPASELSLASRTGWLDLKTGQPWEESLEWAGAPRSMLSDLVAAGTPLGRVRSDHPLTQLREATLTVAGHDHQAAVIGAGAFGDHDELDSCGTAEALLRTVVPQLSDDAIATLTTAGVTIGWHAVKDRWCVLGATQGGLILQRVMSHLRVEREGLPALDQAALAAPPGAATVSVGGEGTDPTFSGSAVPGDVWRAATEMVTEQVRALSAAISDATGPRGELVVTGGWSHSAALMSAKAAALGPLWRTTAGEAGARGAALLGGLAAGTYRSYDDMPQPARTAFTEGGRSVMDEGRIDQPVKGEA